VTESARVSYKRMNETTANRLITAATPLFAARGFDGASVRDITAAAGANLGAITYHFGSKRGLYDAVLEAAFGPIRERLPRRPPAATGHSGLDRVESIARQLFAHITANPDLQLLILREIVAARSLPGPARRTLGVILEAVTGAVRDGQADGSIRDGDPVLMAVSVMSQPAYFGLFRRLLPERLPSVGGGSMGTEGLTEHAVRFIHAGLTSGEEER
jgi:AcrR family transcriptional regulator